ncbi:LacI family transcriptional regulator [Capsulimonas corticalis]|uniref:LacI family transcriptional regulator n=1 Tax=Capsulimonas corticalis TaxID=2219043 RepID=A0A402D152_9BACT|nr:LacI family DNA-binding transcriptional regulator [Capsulimonas corticalis]BDI31660.1 LacI family transcriptional regulator [Capsulimonas corticalis]
MSYVSSDFVSAGTKYLPLTSKIHYVTIGLTFNRVTEVREQFMTTIKDVAKACGVSTATVSYVLNGKRVLLPETRERVLRAMQELNYHPSAVARGLSHKRMNTIGILFGTASSMVVVSHPYTSFILQGVISASSEAGYNVTFYTDPWKTADLSAASYRDQRTDGIIVVAPPMDSDIIPALARCDIPIVAVSYPGDPYDISSVDSDNAHGARLALHHLRDLGHTRIAHLTGPMNMLSGCMRTETYHAFMNSLGFHLPPEYAAGPGAYDIDLAYAQTRRLLTLPNPPTAIFAANDQNALGAMQAARDLGISVPIRLSVVGVDDTPDGAIGVPPLTSVHQPLVEIGETAARLLFRRLSADAPTPSMWLLKPTLIVRGSTAPPVS